ncbi:MAG: tRNA lysidine(34) synthetase TilS [Planktomarina sp.]
MPINFDGLTPFIDQGLWSVGDPLGVAVSGGSDSMALLHLLGQTYPDTPLHVATVDHGLRAEAAAEAAFVAAYCQRNGHTHDTLILDNLAPGPNLQARARTARYGALTRWAQSQHLGAVCIGHTQDDVAETFLLRLARGSGLEGLAAMDAHWVEDHVTFLRPLLEWTRVDLRDVLKGAGQTWCDDPSNDDMGFDRVKLRKLMPALADAGLKSERIASAAAHLRRAQDAIEAQIVDLYTHAVTHDCGSVLVDKSMLNAAAEEPALRLIARLAAWVGNQAYAPRFDQMRDALNSGGKRTLHGVVWTHEAGALRLCREVRATDVSDCANWDGRWEFETWQAGDQVRALGEDGIKFCPNWREAAAPRHVILASPSLWRQGQLIAAPFAGFPEKNTKRDKLRLFLPKWTGHCPLKFPR